MSTPTLWASAAVDTSLPPTPSPPTPTQEVELREAAASKGIFVDAKVAKDRILEKREEMEKEMARLRVKEEKEKVPPEGGGVRGHRAVIFP